MYSCTRTVCNLSIKGPTIDGVLDTWITVFSRFCAVSFLKIVFNVNWKFYSIGYFVKYTPCHWSLSYPLQGSTYLFEVLLWKFILSQIYVGWIKMKIYSPANFPSPSQPIEQYISHKYWKQNNCLKLPFLRPNRYLFVWISNILSRIKCKISSKLTKEVSFLYLYW